MDQIDCTLRHPFRICLVGNSGAGKTYLASQIILNRNKISDLKIEKVVYLYVYWEALFDDLLSKDPSIKFVKTFKELDDEITGDISSLVYIDDMMVQLESNNGSTYLTQWFTVKSSHLNASICVSLHNPFAKNLRTCALNSTYNIYFNIPRDRSMIAHIGRQLFPNNARRFVDAYMNAVSTPYGYLFVNLDPKISDEMRLRNFILPKKDMKFYC